MEDTYVRLINCRFHLLRSSASSFSSQYLLFLKSHLAVFLFFLLISLLPSVLQWKQTITSQNITNPIDFFTWPLLSYMFKNYFNGYFLCPFYLLHSPPAPNFEALQILPFRIYRVKYNFKFSAHVGSSIDTEREKKMPGTELELGVVSLKFGIMYQISQEFLTLNIDFYWPRKLKYENL